MNYMEIFLSMFSFIILVVMILVSVAFLTLFERKILGYIQLRKGPNKVGFLGIVQPFNEAIKLFSKEYVLLYKINYVYFFITPMLNIFLSLVIWFVIPYVEGMFNFNYSLLFMFCCMSGVVYLIMIMSWASNSKYGMLGGLRGMAQVISYEVSLMLIMLSLIFLIMSFKFLELSVYQNKLWFLWVLFPLFSCLFISFLAETNRSPFDFVEGESELVSGFNIEYGSGMFALIFMAEYMSILFFCFILSVMFLGGMNSIFFYLNYLFLIFSVNWIRGVLPRYRYDKLMFLNWKIYLPVSLNYLILNVSIYIYFFKF
uniref:NADH-ubiquinone oxidoreductase chain 1 n=1 Tax=Adicella ragma TaxID=2904898 RepID=A0A9E8RTQ1_9NEOP|nr:NADH dehydrogenase subunit 1 [Adicella ragma]UZZ43726.1 NADH dehydrogenase subunit 1 [Adicella ragma]